jgi:5'-nucleotidase
MFWIGPAGAEEDAGPGTDFNAIRRGFVSITPIHVDLTRYQALEQVAGWVATISTGSKTGTPEAERENAGASAGAAMEPGA